MRRQNKNKSEINIKGKLSGWGGWKTGFSLKS
uniref:Uncharacterized protein n=1 Tax=Anguilla anguilla TaxID=7936 RepID=A0A0E9THD5_ANGAN